jgi:hypothetical protein
MDPIPKSIAADCWRWLAGTLRQAGWAPLLVLAFWAIAAAGFDAYERYPSLDMPTHFCGGVSIAYLTSVGVVRLAPLLGAAHPLLRGAMAIGATAVAAIVWEFMEYLSDLFLGTHLNLGVRDTLSDLFFGLLGATFFVALRAGSWLKARAGLAV